MSNEHESNEKLLSSLNPDKPKKDGDLPFFEEEPEFYAFINLIKWLLPQWKIILLGTLIGLIYSFQHALGIPNTFQSSILLESSSMELSKSPFREIDRIGGLANLMGISIGGTSNVEVINEIIKSRTFLSAFIVENNLMPQLYPESWDKEKGTWKKRMPQKSQSEIMDRINNFILFFKGTVKVLPKEHPEPVDGIGQLQGAIETKFDKKSGLITISLKRPVPEQSADWLVLLVQSLNKHLQEKAINILVTRRAFYEKELEKTTISDLRALLYSLIQEQTRQIMFAEATENYALRVVDPPVIPKIAISPKRSLWVVFGTFAGMGISVFGLLMFKGFMTLRLTKP